jgi:ferric iron reductase protein FhuF
MTHPITQTLRRGHHRSHVGCHLGMQTDSAGATNWLPIATLTADRPALHRTLAKTGREVGSARRDVQASLFLEAYAWRLVLALSGALVAEQRVIAPTADEVSLRPGEGRPSELQLAPHRFYVLPADAAVAHREATVAHTSAQLPRLFERALIEHFDIIVNALNAISGRSTRALWRTIGDRTATALLYAGHACHNPHAGEHLAHDILRNTRPLQSTPAYTTMLVEDRPTRVHLRRGCCLWWRTTAATYCATCPLQRRTDTTSTNP